MKSLVLIFAICFSSFVGAQELLYKVLYAKGDAYFTREDNRRNIVKGDLLMPNDIVETEADALVVLSFGEDYKSKMKVTQNSQVTLEPISEIQDGSDKVRQQSLYVKLGNIVIDYVNKEKKKNRLEIKTKSASMGIRGTRFFVHVTPEEDTVVAVHHGVVAVKHMKNKNLVVLNNKQGVVMSPDTARDRMESPSWFKQINWDFDVFADEYQKLYHGKGFTGDVEKAIYRSSTSINLKNLEEDQKKLQSDCDAKKGNACGKLALQLLAKREEGDTQQVRLLFKKGCEHGDVRSCVWIGRTEYEFGDKKRGKKHLHDLCVDRKMSYSCYMMWEISQKEADDPQTEYYLKRSVEAFQDIKDFDETLAMFSGKCDTNDSIACTNLGILLDNMNKPDKAKEHYEKGCALGDGEACSNLGYIYQQKGNMEEAQKFYQKSCYLNTSVGCYNLACVHSTKNNLDLSVQYLKMAIVNGYMDWEHIETDKDLANLKKSEDYQKILKEYKK